MRWARDLALDLRYAFRPRKPRLVGRLAAAVLKSKLGRPPLRYVDFSVDFGCNLRCQHCFATALEATGRRRMEPKDYERVARECMGLGAIHFSFQGGEVLLLENLDEVIAACRPDRNLISVTTNGVLLSEARVADLCSWGVDILTVSLDSADPSEHDRFRGAKGVFEKTLAGVHRALAGGLNVTLGTVVTPETIRSGGLADMVVLAERLGVLLMLILPVPAGRWAGQTDVLLSEHDQLYVRGLTRRSPLVRTDLQANLGGHGCGAAKEILYLTPYGDVLSCPFMHIGLGNVFEEPVEAIRGRALQNPYFSDYWPRCLVSTDERFVRDHLSKTFSAEALPIPWEEAFGAPAGSCHG